MQSNNSMKWFAGLVALTALVGMANGANAQERGFFSEDVNKEAAKLPAGSTCSGPVSRVIDVGFEGLKTTAAVFGSNPGGGEGKQFDKAPILTTKVTLAKGACLDAHLSALVGGKPVYGHSALTLFQATLTGSGFGPRHIYGHYETPYGIPSPAVALQAENDVDMFAANFFQRVGAAPHDVPPGNYQVDVWWAGAPPGAPGGAIGAAFVLKLYLR